MLCFTAHPDDIDFGAAGTIAAWTAAGVAGQLLHHDRRRRRRLRSGPARGNRAAARPRSSERAAALVGVTDIHYLHQRDGYLEPSHEVMREVVRLIRQLRPDVVLSMHPERNWNRIQKSHPDHLAVGEAVTRAVYPALENPFAYPELAEAGLEAYKLPWLWLFAGPEERENHFVDVTGPRGEQAGRHPYPRQPASRRGRPWTAPSAASCSAPGARAGLPAGRSAEAFHVVDSQRPGDHRRVLSVAACTTSCHMLASV